MCGRPGWLVDPARHRSPRPRPAHRPGLPDHRTPGRDRSRRAYPGLRFALPAQVPVPLGRLLDGQLGQWERLQPLVRNGPTAQDRDTEDSRGQTSLRSLQGAPPVTQPLAESLAGLLGEPAAGAVHLVLQPRGHGDRVVVVASHCPTQQVESVTLLVQQGSRPRLVHRAPHPPEPSPSPRPHRFAEPNWDRAEASSDSATILLDVATILPARRAASTRGRPFSCAPPRLPHALNPRGGRRRLPPA